MPVNNEPTPVNDARNVLARSLENAFPHLRHPRSGRALEDLVHAIDDLLLAHLTWGRRS